MEPFPETDVEQVCIRSVSTTWVSFVLCLMAAISVAQEAVLAQGRHRPRIAHHRDFQELIGIGRRRAIDDQFIELRQPCRIGGCRRPDPNDQGIGITRRAHARRPDEEPGELGVGLCLARHPADPIQDDAGCWVATPCASL